MSFTAVAKPIDIIQQKIGILYNTAVEHFTEFRGELTLYVKPEYIVEMCRTLKHNSDLGYNFLADLTAVDNLNEMKEGEPRFHVVYNLFSTKSKHRIRLKIPAPGDPPSIETVTSLWCGANWHERECYDMFGIIFEGHPDLRRILMPSNWEGYPLRKDFPVSDQETYEYINKQLADE